MEIVKLPVESWQEYKALRLRALKEDPQAFGASYQKNVEYPDEEWKRRLVNGLGGDRNWLLFARENGKLVGMIGAFMEEDSEDTATIISVYVPKEDRGKGISAILMQGMLKELSAKPNLKKVNLTVNKDMIPAVGLYNKFDFIEVGIQPYKMGDGNTVDELMMERRLPFRQ
jgi:ribosomal protein S18 acetylase RimI-like enzyme